MKKVLVFISALSLGAAANAQCTSGNCSTGQGSYNYGWCQYTGEFKNGKPEGKGSMKYDDYTYIGTFINGLEDGSGLVINKDGTKETATYKAGKKVHSELTKIAESDYKPLIVQDVNCLSGDCITGIGTYKFPSGNKYEGSFVERRREGKGVFYFANGDKFDGTWLNNKESNGTYFFSTGAKYTGTYDNNGYEYNGTITSPTGMSIPYVNGKPIIPVQPKLPVGNYDLGGQSTGRQASTERVRMPCSVCFGTGKTSSTQDWSNYGAAQGGGRESYRLERVYSSCYKCHGSGYE